MVMHQGEPIRSFQFALMRALAKRLVEQDRVPAEEEEIVYFHLCDWFLHGRGSIPVYMIDAAAEMVHELCGVLGVDSPIREEATDA